MLRTFVFLSAFLGFTGVALGAYGAHSLKSRVSVEDVAVFQTGVHYQMIHALALFGVALLSLYWPGRLVVTAGWLFVVGTLLFSGSLYVLVLVGLGRFGLITPAGGMAFLAGWLCLVIAALKAA